MDSAYMDFVPPSILFGVFIIEIFLFGGIHH